MSAHRYYCPPTGSRSLHPRAMLAGTGLLARLVLRLVQASRPVPPRRLRAHAGRPAEAVPGEQGHPLAARLVVPA